MTTPQRNTMNGKPVLTRPAKTVLNMHSAFEHKLLCDGPTFSLGDACAYSCSFCYVPDMMRKAAYVPKDQGAHADIVVRRENALDTLLNQLTNTSKRLSYRTRKFSDHTDQRVIYSSPLVDVAANMDLVRETVQACILLLTLTHWHIRLLSKSNLLSKVAELLIKTVKEGGVLGRARHFVPLTEESIRRRMIFGVSTGTLDDAQAAAFEQGCPKVSKRLESLHWLQDNGFRTFGMICPTLPQQNYNKWATDILAALRPDKCEHIWAEVINVRGDSLTNTVKCLHEAGYEWQAAELGRCATDKEVWEHHARQTFLSLRSELDYLRQLHTPQATVRLRFLQYVTKETRPWWQSESTAGAILL